MILFFDRSVGKRIPRALRQLQAPVGVEHHRQLFRNSEDDDLWLPIVGSKGWFVAGFDHSYHKPENEAELRAIRDYEIGIFYLWGPAEPIWNEFQVFVRAFPRIVAAAANTPRPFIYAVQKNSALHRVPIGGTQQA